MKYITFNQKYENQIVNLWNECCTSDPITIHKFRQQALYDDNFNPELCFIALDEESVVGFILATKRIFPYLERGLKPDRGWINVLFVDKKYRNQRIGKHLYQLAEDQLKSLGVKEITLAAYSPSYFFSGIDEINYHEASLFFKKLGYQSNDSHYSMSINLKDYEMSKEIKMKKKEFEDKGYKFTHFKYEYSLELLKFLKNEFGGGWKRNALMSMKNGTAEDVILLVLHHNQICGFSMSAIDGNPCRFGPIGISKDKRNEGIGTLLLQYAFTDFKNKGIDSIFFMSTDENGKRYYERNGFEVIRVFKDYRKTID